MNISFIAIGSNIGDKLANIDKAIKIIDSNPFIKIRKISQFYETPPVGFENQDNFINGVIKIETELSPEELLELLQYIEKKVGRKKTFKWGPRVIDLDILFYNEEIINKKGLVIPHPYLHERAFVLVPFMDIDKNFIHPVFKKSIDFFYNKLDKKELKLIKQIRRINNEIFH